MLGESNWDRRGVRRQLVVDANTHFGHPSAPLLDESVFGKKGNMSAGVARQWNGRLGKVDNCQVGVFAAVTRDGVASVVDADLYLPETWTRDTTRCEAVGVPLRQASMKSLNALGNVCCEFYPKRSAADGRCGEGDGSKEWRESGGDMGALQALARNTGTGRARPSRLVGGGGRDRRCARPAHHRAGTAPGLRRVEAAAAGASPWRPAGRQDGDAARGMDGCARP